MGVTRRVSFLGGTVLLKLYHQTLNEMGRRRDTPPTFLLYPSPMCLSACSRHIGETEGPENI